ncbi:hypothetical protein AX15_003825 [Amanita polypyramis BW_CC]|nr:hypothetical protein AX15_003825 [Amanita polypyramis BW_CC]
MLIAGLGCGLEETGLCPTITLPLNRPEVCAFCSISVEKGFKILWEDTKYVAFSDRNPASRYHFLVVPRKHIGNVKTLGGSDVPMLREMRDIGNRLMDSNDVPMTMRRMGFHISPFSSVKHLHLHVQGLPYTPPWRAAKYPIASGFRSHTKGFSWFVEAEQAIRILERGRLIRITPC